MTEDIHIDFRNLTREEQQELNEFEDFVRMHTIPINEAEKIIKERKDEEFFLLGLTDSEEIKKLNNHYKNTIYWISGHIESLMDRDFRLDPEISAQNLDTVERYLQWLIRTKKNIVLFLPKGLFTYFSKENSDIKAELATIREFEYIIKNLNLGKIDEEKLMIVG